jgi:NAD(P)-dependent dehydrogenase (short-subunit alcohol dehydrogenase family)
MAEAEWRRAIDVNVTGSFLVCKHAIPAIIAAGGGNIILMASQMAKSNTPALRLLHDHGARCCSL